MSSLTTTEIPRLVTAPREQYLRQNETRIRSEARPPNTSDPQIAKHLSAVEMAEDIIDRHEVAIEANRRAGIHHMATAHEIYAAKATQLKLYHLDMLAHLLI